MAPRSLLLCSRPLLVLLAALWLSGVTAAAQREPPLITAPVRVTDPSPYAPACDGTTGDASGMSIRNGVVEPRVAVNPRDAEHIVAVWQQDRWSDGAAAGLRAAVSRDGGRSWTPSSAAFSRCSGGSPANGGDYERATDPWVTFAPDGAVYQSALVVSGNPGPRTSAILVSKSSDGGVTWQDPITLIRDSEPAAFNDKESITADSSDARLVYAVWDRLAGQGGRRSGPTWFARSVDGGASWERPRPIYTPPTGQTIANQIVVLPDGDLLNVFTMIEPVRREDGFPGLEHTVAAIRSSDKGVTWSAPVRVSRLRLAAVEDPDTGDDVRTGTIVIEPAVDRRTGALYITWQDARFGGDGRPGIALVTSTDGGHTWSEPMQVNRAAASAAFTPNIGVTADGTVGVAYYDLRANTPDPATLPTGYWLATCRSLCQDPAGWQETLIADPFELPAAPLTDRGYFLGDYQGMATTGDTFMLLFVQANAGDTGRPSDVWFATARVSGG